MKRNISFTQLQFCIVNSCLSIHIHVHITNTNEQTHELPVLLAEPHLFFFFEGLLTTQQLLCVQFLRTPLHSAAEAGNTSKMTQSMISVNIV